VRPPALCCAATTIVDAYPLFTVAKLAESRAFFVDTISLEIVFEASWVAVLGTGDGRIRLGLNASDHPSAGGGADAGWQRVSSGRAGSAR
jgi:hypothetical protein